MPVFEWNTILINKGIHILAYVFYTIVTGIPIAANCLNISEYCVLTLMPRSSLTGLYCTASGFLTTTGPFDGK